MLANWCPALCGACSYPWAASVDWRHGCSLRAAGTEELLGPAACSRSGLPEHSRQQGCRTAWLCCWQIFRNTSLCQTKTVQGAVSLNVLRYRPPTCQVGLVLSGYLLLEATLRRAWAPILFPCLSSVSFPDSRAGSFTLQKVRLLSSYSICSGQVSGQAASSTCPPACPSALLPT